MDYAVVTGTSRGLGEACAKLLLESGIHVLGVSRQGNPLLERYAKENKAEYRHYECNLADIALLDSTVKEIVTYLFSEEKANNLYLINNAATLSPINQAVELRDAGEITRHMQVNLASPMTLMNTLLYESEKRDTPFIGINITSGASRRPIYGFSAYCSAKAGLDMYTKTVATELETIGSNNKVVGFSPGIMDTEMQEQIRSSSVEAFYEVEKFREYKRQDLLKRSEEVSGILVDILTDPGNADNGRIYDVNDYL